MGNGVESWQAGGQFDGFAEVGELGGGGGADGGPERDDLVQDMKGVFAHFMMLALREGP